MTVEELIDLLEKCDPKSPVGVMVEPDISCEIDMVHSAKSELDEDDPDWVTIFGIGGCPRCSTSEPTITGALKFLAKTEGKIISEPPKNSQ